MTQPRRPSVTFREPDRRPGFRARHLIRQVARNRNQNVRRSAFNELMTHLSRRHRQKLPAAPVSLRAPGDHRPLTLKARHLLRSLRAAKSWPVVRRILAELHSELERGKRLRTRVARSKPVRSVRKAGRKVAEVGRTVRGGVQRAHEPHLARAERKQAVREAGTARTPVRERLAARNRTSLTAPRRTGGRRHREARPESAREPVRVKAVMVPRDTAPREPARTPRTRT